MIPPNRILLATALLATGLHAQTTVIDATFDDVANDTNDSFSILTNTPAFTGGATWDPVTGLIDRSSNTNSTAGVVATTTVDFTTLGSGTVILTIDVEAGSGGLVANGMFFGFQQGDGGENEGGELWNNMAPSFGLVINGSTAGRLGNLGVGPGGRTLAGTTFQNGPTFGTTSLGSINDGFTVELALSAAGYRITLTGLETSTGIPITGGVGDWTGSSFDFSEFSSSMHAGVSTQGSGGGTLDLASIEVVIEPDSDGDGLPDSYEDATPGLDKNNSADASQGANDGLFDDDGLTNLEEYRLGTDPNGADGDMDGLNDGEEVAVGTNPFVDDSDADGLTDGEEVYGNLNPYQPGHIPGTSPGGTPGEATDPLDPDSDFDGLTDFEELDNGNGSVTDPNNYDTDGDNLEDAFEISTGLDPGDGTGDNGEFGDPDADGLNNGDEQIYFTNPLVDDTDGDGLKDGEEVDGTLNPYQAGHIPGDPPAGAPGAATDPLDADSDNDGVSDFAEIDNGNRSVSNPNDPDTDQDTLLDGFELAYNLDPTENGTLGESFPGALDGPNGALGDPDGDNVVNTDEQFYGADPNLTDTDGDTLDDEAEIFTYFTHPGRADTDGDLIRDDEELVAGADEFVTDPLNGDTDLDTFKDYIEIQADSLPDDALSVPTFPAIAWSAEAFDEETDLSTEGTLLFADNIQGEDVTVNGIPFTGYVIDGNDRSTPHLQTLLDSSSPPQNTTGLYDGEVPALVPLLSVFWFQGDPLAVNMGITGLTPGKIYLVQVGRADDRTGTIVDRYMLADGYGGNNTLDPIGPTNTTYGGPLNPAVLFTGTFTAQYTVQVFAWEQYLGGAVPGIDAPLGSHLPFIQVREIESSTAVVVTNVQHTGSSVEVSFTGLDPARSYQLVRSADLQDGFPTVVDGPRTPAGAADTFSDSGPLPAAAYYQLEEMP